MNTLTITLRRISPTEHEFAYRRADGTRESFSLDTKSYLFHDFLHFAFESEARLMHSFYGRLLEGKPYKELSMTSTAEGGSPLRNEGALTECLVGILTGVVQGGATPEDAQAATQNLFDAYGEKVPTWFTKELIERVKERMRRLLGEWRKLLFGESMTMTFPRFPEVSPRRLRGGESSGNNRD